MKNLNFAFFISMIVPGLLAVSLAIAQTSPGTKMVYSNSKQDHGRLPAAIKNCADWIYDTHTKWLSESGKAATETECSIVTPKVTITSRSIRYSDFICGGFLMGCSDQIVGTGVEYTVRYEVNCQRRPLGESQAIHQFHQCKTSPSAQCVSPEYLNYINSVALTQYNDVDASACSQLNSGSSYSTTPYNTQNNDNFGFR